MKKTVILGLCLWLLAIGKASAENTISVSNITIPQGGQATMEIVCNFSTTFVGGQLDIELPDDGMVTPNMSGTQPVAIFGFTGTDHSISSSQLKNAQNDLLQKYRFLFTSMSSSALPSSGILLSIVLNADENSTVGEVYNVKLSGIELGTANSEKTNIEDVTFTITIGDALPKVTLDETSTAAPDASDGEVDVMVNRTIKANEWSTICLPFDMTEAQVKASFGEDVQLADFSSWSYEGTAPSVDKITINFTDVTEIEKNHPYIIKVSQAITSFTVKNVVVDPEEFPQTYKGFDQKVGKQTVTHKGYMYGYYAQGDMDKNELFLSENKFWYNNGGTTIMAFRATFYFTDSSNNFLYISSYTPASSRIVMSFNENENNSETTAIKDVKAIGNGKTYNLNGQQVNKPGNGLYIKNGKKVIIK
jgi:hypothetical protein